MSLNLYRSVQVCRSDRSSRCPLKVFQETLGPEDTKAHEEGSSRALVVVLFGSRKRREVEICVSDTLLPFFLGLRVAEH